MLNLVNKWEDKTDFVNKSIKDPLRDSIWDSIRNSAWSYTRPSTVNSIKGVYIWVFVLNSAGSLVGDAMFLIEPHE